MSSLDRDLAEIEDAVERDAKKPFTAYVLWLFLGWLGAHRLYAGRTKSAFGMAALSLSVVGLPISILWWMTDAIRLGAILSEERELLFDQHARLLIENEID